MAEGTGFTGMPTYPAYGVNPPTTAFPEATTTSEPVASSSAPRWYAADYHHPLPATGAYVDVPGYATLSGLRRGPESCGSRSRGSGRSSNRSLTRSEINEVRRGAISKIVGDLTQEIRDKLKSLIPPQVSPTTVGMSPHRVQANHLVAGLTNTRGSLRSRPMPNPSLRLWLRLRRGEGGRAAECLAAFSPKDSKNHGLVPPKALLDGFFGGAKAICFRFFYLGTHPRISSFRVREDFLLNLMGIMGWTNIPDGCCMTFYTLFPDFSEKNHSGCNFSAPPTVRPKLAHGGMMVALAWGH